MKRAKEITKRSTLLATIRSEFPKSTAIDLENELYEMINKALMLGGVVSSSDFIVVELSDDEIKIISEQELKEWQQSAIEFDGFEGWIVRGRLVK